MLAEMAEPVHAKLRRCWHNTTGPVEPLRPFVLGLGVGLIAILPVFLRKLHLMPRGESQKACEVTCSNKYQ